MSKILDSGDPEFAGRVSPTKDVKLTLLGAALSATLRMVTPTFGLFFGGLIIDFTLQQEAFYAIIGAVAGFAVAGFLIYLQVKKLKIQGEKLSRGQGKQNRAGRK